MTKPTQLQQFYLREIHRLKLLLTKVLEERTEYSQWYAKEKEKLTKEVQVVMLQKNYQSHIIPINKRIGKLEREIEQLAGRLDKLKILTPELDKRI